MAKTVPTAEKSLWTMYQNGVTYLRQIGLYANLPIYVDFYEGRQWPDATEITQDLPRPVVNVIKKICDNKKAGILSSRIKLNYIADDPTADATTFNNFAEYIQKEIGQVAADYKAVNDGVKKGGYAYHYYWDADAKGKKGVKEGALQVEVIDILNVVFANPKEVDEQKQKWIMIASREELDAVQETVGDNEVLSADNNDFAYDEKEQEGTEYITVLTRYFRKNGKVYFEKGTRGGTFTKAIPLTPDVKSAINKIKGESNTEDVANDGLPDDAKAKVEDERGFELYPVVIGQYEERDQCIYGMGEVEGLLPNQKLINFIIAMEALNIQDNAWPKTITTPDALDDQEITNEPGQQLIDYSTAAKAGGKGIYRLQGAQLTAAPTNFVQAITDLTRMATGASEVVTGDAFGSNMSGAAIAQWQSQALKPIEGLQQRFWRVKEKQGKVLAQFFTYYYQDKTYMWEEEKEDKKVTQAGVFNGSDYMNTEFSIVVDAGAATMFSEASDINFVEMALSKGYISFKTAVKAYPEGALSNRKGILKAIQDEENGQLAQMAEVAGEMEAQLKKASEIIEKQSQAIQDIPSLISENTTLKQQMVQLFTEYSGKIQQANGEMQSVTEKATTAEQDAAQFAQIISKLTTPKASAVTAAPSKQVNQPVV